MGARKASPQKPEGAAPVVKAKKPKKAAKPVLHPPFKVMIYAAIKALSHFGKAVSLQAIANYVIKNYKVGKLGRKFVSRTLKRLVVKKELDKIKGSYKIPKHLRKEKKVKKPKKKKVKKPKKKKSKKKKAKKAKKAKKPKKKKAKKAKKPKKAKKSGKKAKKSKRKAPKKKAATPVPAPAA
eukprot:NODE_1553_length_579_cov_1443.073585_g272_i1.p2 GENE.NODE_1553_length_579_cov_1443.073585_g272_i1~~NODE_1553_length_579_cov_1443.073585_g272_i1.p2  ORF type:complete len:189 (+),score=108.91 NODE_1553_length_579_cov_1443.073585_g272_i1:27-569(+)